MDITLDVILSLSRDSNVALEEATLFVFEGDYVGYDIDEEKNNNRYGIPSNERLANAVSEILG